jgi:tetratricopeptide (TPR) repeat protein
MSNIAALCKLASDCLDLGQIKQAKELFVNAMELDSNCIEAHRGLARIADQAGDFSTSAGHYEQLTLLQPMEAQNFTQLGTVYNHLGEHTKAVDVLRKAIQRDKRSAEAYFQLGLAEWKRKQSQQAISAYREAARLNPKMAEAHQQIANIYLESSNVPMAILSFKKALEVRPDFELAREGLQKAEAANQQNKQAMNPFGRLVDPDSYQRRASAEMARGLTEAERYDDRQQVKAIAEEIERLAKASLEFLWQKLEPSILELQRTMAEGSKAQISLADVAEKYQAAVDQWNEYRKLLKRKVLELRAHEELINAPEVKL